MPRLSADGTTSSPDTSVTRDQTSSTNRTTTQPEDLPTRDYSGTEQTATQPTDTDPERDTDRTVQEEPLVGSGDRDPTGTTDRTTQPESPPGSTDGMEQAGDARDPERDTDRTAPEETLVGSGNGDSTDGSTRDTSMKAPRPERSDTRTSSPELLGGRQTGTTQTTRKTPRRHDSVRPDPNDFYDSTTVSDADLSGSYGSAGELRSDIESQTGLTAGEDFTVTKSGDQFNISYTDQYKRQLAAGKLDQSLKYTDVDPGDVVFRNGNATVDEGTADEAAQNQAAAKFGLYSSSLEVTDEGVQAVTGEAAESIAEYFAKQNTPGAEDATSTEVIPGVYRATPTNTSGGMAVAGQSGAVTVASESGRELISTMRQYEDVRQGLLVAAGVEQSADARNRAFQKIQERTEADLARSDVRFSEDTGGPASAVTGLARGDAGAADRGMTVTLTESGRAKVMQDAKSDLFARVQKKTGAHLERSDVAITSTTSGGSTTLTASLTDSGRKELFKQDAPLQGVPVLEGVTEWGSGYAFEFKQATEPVEDTFNKWTPDTGFVEDTWNKWTPDASELTSAATVAAGPAAAEPTPVGEAAVGATLATAAVLYAGSQAASMGDSELDVTREQFPSELAVTGEQFPDEVEPPAGHVPKHLRGELRPGEMFPGSELEPTTDAYPDELSVPESDTGDGAPTDGFPDAETSTAVDQGGGVVPQTPGDAPTGPQGPTVPQQPARPGVGEGTGTGAGAGVGWGELPRRGEQSTPVEDFFDVDIRDAYESGEPTEYMETARGAPNANAGFGPGGVSRGVGYAGPFSWAQGANATASAAESALANAGVTATAPARLNANANVNVNVNAEANAASYGYQYDYAFERRASRPSYRPKPGFASSSESSSAPGFAGSNDADRGDTPAFGYLGETYAGFAGVNYAEAAERTTAEDVEQRAFGEAQPVYTPGQAADVEATFDALVPGFDIDLGGDGQ
jgi:hypothetical protein